MKNKSNIGFAVVPLAVTLAWSTALAQVATPPRTQAPTPRRAAVSRRGPVIVETQTNAPQVVTILHRLNGLKMFRLLVRSTEELGTIARIDDAFRINDEVHTNVI